MFDFDPVHSSTYIPLVYANALYHCMRVDMRVFGIDPVHSSTYMPLVYANAFYHCMHVDIRVFYIDPVHSSTYIPLVCQRLHWSVYACMCSIFTPYTFGLCQSTPTPMFICTPHLHMFDITPFVGVPPVAVNAYILPYAHAKKAHCYPVPFVQVILRLRKCLLSYKCAHVRYLPGSVSGRLRVLGVNTWVKILLEGGS